MSGWEFSKYKSIEILICIYSLPVLLLLLTRSCKIVTFDGKLFFFDLQLGQYTIGKKLFAVKTSIWI